VVAFKFHESELSLNEMVEKLGYTIDRSGEHVMLKRGDESFVRPPYMETVYMLATRREIAWYPRLREWAHIRGLATDKRKHG
jgi:hypothetical protein